MGRNVARVVVGLGLAIWVLMPLRSLGRGLRRPEPAPTLTDHDHGAEVTTSEGEGGRTLGVVRFSPCIGSPPRRVHTRRGWVSVEAWDLHVEVVERLIRIARSAGVQAPPRIPTCDEPRPWAIQIVWAAVIAAVLAALVGAARRARVTVDVRIPHMVPVAIQLSIYAYWSLYWPGVALHVPSLVLQLAFAYALEAALCFARFGAWRAGVGPMPVVLSANLFAWLDPVGSVIVIGAAIASKTLLRREGRHILNPSAAGLVVGGAYLALWPASQWDGLFHTQNLAPSMVELILVLSALPLLRFRLGLIPLAAVLAMMTLPIPGPGVTQPGTIIALALFAADPATTPKTQEGRLLFGTFVGAGILLVSLVLVRTHHPDDFSKVVPVTVANVLAPAFDRLGARLAGWIPRNALAPRYNAVSVALWCLIVSLRHAADKPRQFEAALHWTYGTPTVVRGADDVPRCADNPAFCRQLAVGDEIAAWASVRRAR